ncbi:hypothetical protein [Gilvimarinus algae]|uniref:Uncharacterized protein n=1 Tax=Gilvimarinus algae TaxID=3058037 RepID=A0ABT8TD37_9GAMM|nr:hypothetical protein [Gilvimarinus sp. SDUM040014]MDO3381520.1 hypothetical protein [Gilvimarinus sp. SDUM040014]
MKRAKKTLEKHFPPVLFYKDDLMLLTEALSQNGGEINIKTDEYEYDDIGELFANEADSLTGLSMSRRSPYVSVEFDGRLGLWLYAGDDDLMAKGIFADALSILKPRARLFHVVLKRILQIGAWGGALGGGILIGAGHFKEGMILFLLPFFDLLFSLSKHRSIVNRQLRAHKKSFWQRNSDQIVVALIGAVAGAIIVLSLTHFLSNGSP